jgi:hypothetical protein
MNNAYEQKFYVYDKFFSIANFKKTFWIPKMTSKLEELQNSFKNPSMKQQTDDDLLLIRNEIKKEMLQAPTIPYKYMDSLDATHISNSIISKTTDYMNTLNNFYIQQSVLASDAKDKLVESLQTNDAQKAAFLQQKDDYSNDNLSDLVTNKNDFTNHVIEVDHELIQKADPIYLDPVKSSFFGNAHFYAPTKRMFGQLFDTFWVNMGIIWGMTIFLIITLYFDALKRLLDSFGNIRLPFKIHIGGRKE